MAPRWIFVSLMLAPLVACGGGESPSSQSASSQSRSAQSRSAQSRSAQSRSAQSRSAQSPEVTAGGEAGAEAAMSLPNQRRLEGGLLVGGQPTDADLGAAAEQGYTAVVSLRTPSDPGFEEERAQAEALGLDFHNVPVDGAEDLTVEHARELDAILANAEGPVVLHCGTGNRVGAMLALRAFLDGADLESALQTGRDAGLTSLEDAVRQRLASLCEARPERTC